MKRLPLTLISLLAVVCMQAQLSRYTNTESHLSEQVSTIFDEIPDYREINGGTKIIVSYPNNKNIPAEMKGAFEYAAKLWEEVLPTSLPIRIKVDIKRFRKDKVAAEVGYISFDCLGERDFQYASPLSLIKNVVLQEDILGAHHRFISDNLADSIKYLTDIYITYDQNMIDQFSFDLDGEPNSSKYDFVTLALRNIAEGLGFITPFTAIIEKKEFEFSEFRLTPFESCVMGAVGSSNPRVAYENSTKGSLDLNIIGLKGIKYPMTMYAPAPWVNGASLHYFIPNDNPVSKLLTYEFGKGYVMRDLSGIDWEDFFYGALDWRADKTVGSPSNTSSQIGSTDDILPYKGSVTLGFDSNDMQALRAKINIQNTVIDSVKSYSSLSSNYNVRNSDESEISKYCNKFNPLSPDGPKDHGLTLSVLLKNGSWECIYNGYDYGEGLTVDIEELGIGNAHPDSLARSTTGGLRYRLSRCEEKYRGGIPYYKYEVKYLTRNYTPQKAVINYYSEMLASSRSLASPLSDDEYFVDVPIGIANIEGTTRVVVQQLDEGEIFPFDYEVEDFRKGYFIANLDRELSTQLTVISYNENGYTRSNTITIPPLGRSANPINLNLQNGQLIIEGLTEGKINSGSINYAIYDISNSLSPVKSRNLEANTVDVDDLKRGVYVFTLFNGSDIMRNLKFAK